MSLSLNRVVQTECPACRIVLRVPANWLAEPLRCKHCGLVFKAKASQKRHILKRAIQATSHLGRRIKRRNVPVAQPVPSAAAVAAGQKRRRLKPGSGWLKVAGILFFLLGVGSLAAVLHRAQPGLLHPVDEEPVVDAKRSGSSQSAGAASWATSGKTTESIKPPVPPPAPKPPASKPPPNPKSPDFPRSLLAISINNYPSANPVSYGGNGARAFDQITRQFADVLHIPQERVTILSDRAPPGLALPPIKTLLMDAFEQFLSTKASRAMDRVVVVFVGHGIDIGGRAYLVPLQGELNDATTLLPLDWLYARLAASPAQQKLLIIDVCRFDKQRGEERGAVARMSEAFEAALHTPPRGVEVISACSAGEYSWEVESNPDLDVQGGVFLNSIAIIKGQGGLRGVTQKPDSPLPVEQLFDAMTLRTTPKVTAYLKERQTPQLFGAPTERTVPYDPRAAAPAKVVLELKNTDFSDGIAGASDLAGILDLVNQLPPIKQGERTLLRPDALPPYPRARLAAYKADKKDSDYRAFVRDAVALLIKHHETFPETFPRLPANKAPFFEQLKERQVAIGRAYNALEKSLEELTLVEKNGQEETALWRAYHNYVKARVRLRMAYITEYNAMLGKMRLEELPELDPKQHKGYRLASKTDIDEPDARKAAIKGKELLQRLAEEHKGTPWEWIGRREANTSVGLRWVVY